MRPRTSTSVLVLIFRVFRTIGAGQRGVSLTRLLQAKIVLRASSGAGHPASGLLSPHAGLLFSGRKNNGFALKNGSKSSFLCLDIRKFDLEFRSLAAVFRPTKYGCGEPKDHERKWLDRVVSSEFRVFFAMKSELSAGIKMKFSG